MIPEIVKPVLFILVAFVLKVGLGAIGVVLDDGVFNSIVVAVVSYLLGVFGLPDAYSRYKIKSAK